MAGWQRVTYSAGRSVNVPLGQKYLPFISLMLNAYMTWSHMLKESNHTFTVIIYHKCHNYFSSGHTSSAYLKRLRYLTQLIHSGRELSAIKKPPKSWTKEDHGQNHDLCRIIIFDSLPYQEQYEWESQKEVGYSHHTQPRADSICLRRRCDGGQQQGQEEDEEVGRSNSEAWRKTKQKELQ